MPIASASFNDMEGFHKTLRKSKRILALCGAGLSAASGLPTFRGVGGLWRNHKSQDLATVGAFNENPGLVWLFYAYRRHMALNAKPNGAHTALAELARQNPDFKCLTQNVDGLSIRADHPKDSLCALHGSLFSIKCFNRSCDYFEENNFDDPLCPALAAASEDSVDPNKTLPLLDPKKHLARIPESELPHCPKCKTGLLRPAVVWFGEKLDQRMLLEVDDWIDSERVDLMLVIGTTSTVYPAARYVEEARHKGAAVAVVNMEVSDLGSTRDLEPGDFFFQGSAAELVPKMLEPIIGKPEADGTYKS